MADKIGDRIAKTLVEKYRALGMGHTPGTLPKTDPALIERIAKAAGIQAEKAQMSQIWVDELAPVDQSSDWHKDMFIDSYRSQNRMSGSNRAATAKTPSIADFSNAEMVMDMLRRGYAVMKLPEDGGPPEVLR